MLPIIQNNSNNNIDFTQTDMSNIQQYQMPQNFNKQPHKRIQSATIPRNIIPQKLYNQTRFDYILKQADELQGFEFNNDNPALAPYPNVLNQTSQAIGSSNQIPEQPRRPQTAINSTYNQKIAINYDFTARHFPSLCENKLNYQNRSKMHRSQKFGKRTKTSELIEQSNRIHKEKQLQKIQETNSQNQQSQKVLSKQDEKDINKTLSSDIKTDGQSYYTVTKTLQDQSIIEVTQHNLKMEITDNTFASMNLLEARKNEAEYNKIKNNAYLNVEDFENLLKNKHNKTQEDIEQFYDKITQISTYSILAGLSKIKRQPQAFETFALDILLDEDLNPYLLEINQLYAVEVAYLKGYKDVLPDFYHSTLDLILQVYDQNSDKNEVIKDQNNLKLGKNMKIVYNEANGYNYLEE